MMTMTMTMYANKEVSWMISWMPMMMNVGGGEGEGAVKEVSQEERRWRRRKEIGQNVVDEEEGVAVTRKEIWASKYNQNVKDIIYSYHTVVVPAIILIKQLFISIRCFFVLYNNFNFKKTFLRVVLCGADVLHAFTHRLEPYTCVHPRWYDLQGTSRRQIV